MVQTLDALLNKSHSMVALFSSNLGHIRWSHFYMDSFGPFSGPIFFNISLNIKHFIVPAGQNIVFDVCIAFLFRITA